jgi:hypothetical protein
MTVCMYRDIHTLQPYIIQSLVLAFHLRKQRPPFVLISLAICTETKLLDGLVNDIHIRTGEAQP